MESFAELNLLPALQRAITDLGYETPSQIQAQALPILLTQDTDFIGLAATGTGKTAAFTLPLLTRIDPTKRGVQGLILVPTRELSLQVAGQVNLLGKYLNVSALPIYGGAGYSEQLRGLKDGIQIVVGTPGRIIDHLQRRTLRLDDVKVTILDEADEMISMGFREDMEDILKRVPPGQSHIWLFSATMSGPVRKVADQFLAQPQMVQVNRTEMLSSTVEQYYYMTQEQNKPEVLCKLIDAAEDFYGLIFCQMKVLVDDLTRYLAGRGYSVDCLHGDMTQAARETTMDAFRRRQVKILVCTDVASRGLDVKDITHVVNFSLPREMDSYVHRIGRTARSGKTGVAMSLVTPSHRHLVRKIELMTKSRLNEGTIPSRKAIGIKKIATLVGQFTEQPPPTRALALMDESWRTAVAGMEPTEVAARFITMMLPNIFSEEERPAVAPLHAAATPAAGRPAGGPPRVGHDQRQPARRDDKAKRDYKPYPKSFHARKKHGG